MNKRVAEKRDNTQTIARPQSIDQQAYFKIPIYDEWLVHAPLHELNALLPSDHICKLQANVCEDDEVLSLLRNILKASPKHAPTTAGGNIDPRFLVFVTTRGCNLGCVYCHFDGPTAPHNSLELERCRQTIDWMVDALEKHGHEDLPVHFFGGEPFTTPTLIETVIDYTNERCRGTALKPRFIATTNGFVSEARAEWIANHFDQIVLSLDGPKQIHDKNRPVNQTSGSFEITSRTADILSKKDLELSFRGCITSDSVQQMGEIAKWMSTRWHSRSIKFEPLTVNSLTLAAGLEPPDPFDFAVQWFHARDAAARHGVDLTYTPINPGEPRLSSCLVGNDALVVHPDGTINACYLDSEEWKQHGMDLRLGEVSSGQGVNIDQQRVDEVRELVKQKDRCSKCFCRWSCAGGCHVTNTYQGASMEYDSFCVGTRIITACLLLEATGCGSLVKRLLTDRQALEKIARQSTDHLNLEFSHV